jgi:hypothetical protein
MKRPFHACAIAVAFACAAAATAQPVSRHERNGVNWITGGVSEEDREAMRDVAGDFNLKVVVSMRGSGEYRADVPVSIEDQNGDRVLNVVIDGPWLFARVAPGRYRVRTGDGQERMVDVGAAGPVVVYFRSPYE